MTEEKKRYTFTHHRQQGDVVFDAPFFQMLLQGQENGRLPRDIAAHALWHYFCLAAKAMSRAKYNLVYEDELSARFDEGIARNIFQGVAMIHGVYPRDMGRYWEVVRQQRIALGLSSNADLPPRFQFKE